MVSGCRKRLGGRSDGHPLFALVALQDGFTEFDFVVSVGSVGEEERGLLSGSNVLVDGAVVHLVAVGKAFGMAARAVGEVGNVVLEAGRAPLKDLIRFITPTEDYLVGLLKVPANTSFAPVNTDVQAAFPAGGNL